METQIPSVVAVVVTTGPGPGLDATLTSLMAQDYESLSILLLANDAPEDLADRVAAVSPQTLVKVLQENRGYAAACNEATLMVSGAELMLFCHDDVRLEPSCVSELVACLYRNNAGIVTPKFVDYFDAELLTHVGQQSDRFGSVTERIEVGEIDHGQHDFERDVFVAPGGVTLVRVDLFETLRGFDPLMSAIGEDVDLCWRAQIAGARVVVAPAAVVAHRQSIATGERTVSAAGTRRTSRADLQRRNQLATVVTCWTWKSLLSVVPLIILLDLAEILIAAIGRDLDRVGAIAGSWRWIWRRRKNIRQRRHEIARTRVLGDDDIRRLQVGGSSRASTFLVSLFQDGIDVARGILAPALVTAPIERDGVGFASGFNDDESFESESPLEPVTTTRLFRLFTSFRSQLAATVAMVVVWLFGVRNLLGSRLPNVGRLMPLDSWWSTWRHFFASWSPAGVGTGAPGMPGYGVVAFAGTFVFGRMGVLPRAVLVFAVPLGAWGIWQLLRGLVSNRARLMGAVAYMVFPVGINLISRGRVDVLVVVAMMPFALRRLFSLLNVTGFRTKEFAAVVPFGRRTWRSTHAGQSAIVMLQIAVMTAIVPATVVAVILVTLGVNLGHRFVLQAESSLDRPWRTLGNILVGVALLLLPLTCDAVIAGSRALEVFGLPQGSWSGLGLGHLWRGANGTFGTSWTGWILPAISLASLIIARESRRQIAATFASIMAVTLTMATLVGRHWTGAFAPDVDTLLVVVAVGIAVLVAVCVNAIELDLASVSFGRHQVAAAISVVLLIMSVFLFLGDSVSGRYQLPMSGVSDSMGNLGPTTNGGYRVLWLGNEAVLPLPGWTVSPGLAAATSYATPRADEMFVAPASGPADELTAAVDKAMRGETIRLGQLLAPSGIASIVVMNNSAPQIPGLQGSWSMSVPAKLSVALLQQSDLALTSHTGGVEVYVNTAFMGIIAQRGSALSSTASSSDATSLAGWTPRLHFAERTGRVTAGSLYLGLSPATAFSVSVNDSPASRSSAFGWGATYRVRSGHATITLHQFPLNGILALFTLAMWFAFAAGLGLVPFLEGWTERRFATPRSVTRQFRERGAR